MLILPLKKEWFAKIANGEKTIEYREAKEYWEKRIRRHFACEDENGKIFYVQEVARMKDFKIKGRVILQLGYSQLRMIADVSKIEVVNGKDTDLHIDKNVYAIHLENVRRLWIGEYYQVKNKLF